MYTLMHVHYTCACQCVGRCPNQQDVARAPQRAQLRRMLTEPLRTGALVNVPLLRATVRLLGLFSLRCADVYDPRAKAHAACCASSVPCWVGLQTTLSSFTSRAAESSLCCSLRALTTRTGNCAGLRHLPLSVLAVARKQATSQEILLWMTPSEAPKALLASECSELLDPTGASFWIFAQRQPGKFAS